MIKTLDISVNEKNYILGRTVPFGFNRRKNQRLMHCVPWGSVVDPHHVDADPDTTYHPDADPDSDFFYADPYPTFHFDADPDADPDPDPSFQKKAQNIEKVLK